MFCGRGVGEKGREGEGQRRVGLVTVEEYLQVWNIPSIISCGGFSIIQ